MGYKLSNAVVRTTRAEGLDALRFLLAFWVLAAHMNHWAFTTAPHWFTGTMTSLVSLFQPTSETHPAVIAFIVLSGYCIHRNGLRAENTAISPYVIRRTFRILPIFILATGVGALAGNYILGDANISVGGIALKLIGVSAFVPSLNAVTYQGNGPLHTVMVECWLYVVYPLVMLFLIRGGRERMVWIALGAIWILGVLFCRGNPALTNWWHNGSLLGFLLYWWIGAWLVSGRLPRHILAVAVGLWIALSLKLLITGPSSDLIFVEARKVVFALLIGAFIAAIDKPARLTIGRLGCAGYSLYAFHAPVGLVLLLAGFPWWLAMAGAIAFGFLAFLTVESPLTRLGKTIASSTASAAEERYIAS